MKDAKSEKEPTTETEYDKAIRLSLETLEQAKKYRSPPRPRAYAVWYTYVAGEDSALTARVDSELIKTDVVNLDVIEQIYEEHFLQKRLSSGMTRIGDELDAGLHEALHVIRDSQSGNQSYIGSLTEAQDQITRMRRRSDAKRVVAKLVQISQDQLRQTKSVNTELAKVRGQVEELQRELHRLRDSAYLDHLTQIPNRRHLDEVMEREITWAKLHGDPLCVALGDLDHFKMLNDTHGHQVGDAMLKHFAALIKDNIKGRDTPARFGGEEFAILFPKTSLFNAARVVDNLRRILHDTDFILSSDKSTIGRMTVSFGVTQLLSSDSPNDLIERAKKNGRNRVETDM